MEQLRAELPPPLRRKGTGRKTHGRWFAEGVPPRALVSGEDETSALATHYLDQIGEERAAIRSHVEVKLAALIRRHFDQTGRTANATVVINQEVCEGRSSCFTLLPLLLPPGCSITVYTPTTRHTFTGEQ